MTILAFRDFPILEEDGKVSLKSLFVDKSTGLIVRSPEKEAREEVEEVQVQNSTQLLLSPALIDIQINGAYLHDFSGFKDDSPESIAEYNSGLDTVCSRIVETGVGSFVPTLFTSETRTYPTTLSLLKPSKRPGARILGFHAEGPFMNPLKKGAHQAELLQEADQGVETMEKIYGKGNLRPLGKEDEELVRIITLAPEVNGVSESIPELTKRGILVGIGHSNATYEEAEDAVRNGASLVTHLFNAMSPLNHRAPGLPGYTLASSVDSSSSSPPRPFYSLISDSIHTSPHIVRMSYRANPKACILITDALPPLDPNSTNGFYPWTRGQQLRKEGDALYLNDTNTLAGSCASLSKCVSNLSEFAAIPFSEALLCATLHPAQFLGMEGKIGSLRAGARGDLCLWEGPTLKAVWIGGERVFGSKHL